MRLRKKLEPLDCIKTRRPDAARERATGGVGLGLYLCKLVAQAYGGNLTVGNAQPRLEVSVPLPG